ncbi:hypothetical protein BGZ79_004860 [Entomortierella chlamydospora]|nr:hypothetical protein BGZ79_004860 [Entomortierella chlamydospora]
MTRYTKLERKRHIDASESFAVTPLMPSKKPQAAVTPTVAPTKPVDHAKEPTTPSPEGGKKSNKKRKAEDSTTSANDSESGASKPNNEAGPSKKVKEKKNNNKGKDKGGDSKLNQDNSTRSERRRLRRQKEKANASVCFACRKKGHSAKDCKESSGVGLCYNCGSAEHTTKDCKKLSKDGNKFKFATCFVCKEQGHLAGKCPKNELGLYPNGGSCRFCNKVDHLAKDCKLTKEEVGTVTLGKIDLVQGADDDDFHIFVDEKRKLAEEQKTIKKMVKAPTKAPKKVVSF